jgi:hypothetical protein
MSSVSSTITPAAHRLAKDISAANFSSSTSKLLPSISKTPSDKQMFGKVVVSKLH